MKSIIVVLLVLAIVFAAVLTGCQPAANRIQTALRLYEKTLDGPIPEDFCLEIYYIDPHYLTRAPLSAEDLRTYSSATRIYVTPDALANHIPLLKKLNASILQPSKEESHINARLYYVFSAGNFKILDVVISQIHGPVFVNGVEVEDHPVFYELITPFLSEEDCRILGI